MLRSIIVVCRRRTIRRYRIWNVRPCSTLLRILLHRVVQDQLRLHLARIRRRRRSSEQDRTNASKAFNNAQLIELSSSGMKKNPFLGYTGPVRNSFPVVRRVPADRRHCYRRRRRRGIRQVVPVVSSSRFGNDRPDPLAVADMVTTMHNGIICWNKWSIISW